MHLERNVTQRSNPAMYAWTTTVHDTPISPTPTTSVFSKRGAYMAINVTNPPRCTPSELNARRTGSTGPKNLCLTMHQPWASLLVAGVKRVEGRSWHTDHRGKLWVHAAAKEPSAGRYVGTGVSCVLCGYSIARSTKV